MAGNKKPRKKMRNQARQPKQIVVRQGSRQVVLTVMPEPVMPIVYGLAGDKKTDLRMPYHAALESLRNGAGDSDHAHTIFAHLLIAKESAALFENADKTILDGIEAITEVKERADKTGKYGVSGDQFKAISAALVLFDEMQDASTRREVRGAIQKVWKEAA